MTRVAIIEDNAFMRDAWKTFIDFESDLAVIGAFNSCEDAFESGMLSAANVLLLDNSLPGMSSVEGLAIVAREFPELAVVLATVFDDDEHIFKAIQSGAVGYIFKSSSPSQLAVSIRDAHAGGSPITPPIARRIIDFAQGAGSPFQYFNEREIRILTELANGFSYAAIGKSIFLSQDGIRHHIRNIYRKLRVTTNRNSTPESQNNCLIAI